MSLIPSNLIQWGDFGRKCFNINNSWLEAWDCPAARLLYALPVINNLFLRFKETQIYAFNKAGLPWSLNQENNHSTSPINSLQTRLISSLERSEPPAFLLSASISVASFGLLSPPLAFGFSGLMILLLVDAVRKKADLLEISRLQPTVPTTGDQFIHMDERSLRVNFQTITRHGKPDIEGQKMILQRVRQLLASKDPKPEIVALTHCAALRSEDLSSFFHPNLQILDLTGTGIESIPQGIEQCQLKELTLNGCNNLRKLEKTGWLSGSPYQFHNLEKLHISGCDWLTSLQVEAPNLNELKANNNKNLTKGIVRASFQATLNIDQTPLNFQTIIEESFPEFAEVSLDFCSVLRYHLNTEANNDTSKPEKTIGGGILEFLKKKIGITYFQFDIHPTPPKTLSFSDIKLDRNDQQALAIFLRYLNPFSTLNLNGSFLSFDGVKRLSEVLPLTQITELKFGGSFLGAQEIKALIEVLPQTQISNLSLIWHSIEGDWANHLMRILPTTKITELSLRKSSLRENEIEMLSAACSQGSINLTTK